MSLIRHGQKRITALFPHNGNKRYIVTNKKVPIVEPDKVIKK